MKHYNKLIFLVCLIFSSMVFSISSSAHTTSISVLHDPTYTGWDIFNTNDKHHSNSTTAITVSKGEFTVSDFGSYISDAVSSWNSATFDGRDLLNMSESSNGYVKFCKKTLDEMEKVNKGSAWAFVYRSKAAVDSNGHYINTAGNVEIWVNWNDVLSGKSVNAKRHVALHELGHVIGLKDIPYEVSPNAYLMCNEFGQYYAAQSQITLNDKQGAAVILGQHTSHSNNTYGNYSEDSTKHRVICDVCGSYTLASHVYSTYSALNGSDTSQHRKLCACGEYITEAHTWGEWTPSSQYTEKRVCQKCGRSEEHAIGDTSGLVISIAPMYTEEQLANGEENGNIYGIYDMTAFQNENNDL